MDAGTAIGAVSLAFYLFSGCIKGCKLLAEAHGMPKEYDYLLHRLKLEELKLLEWWLSYDKIENTVGIFEDAMACTKQRLIINTLAHIKALTLDMKKIRKRFNLHLEGLRISEESKSSPSLIHVRNPSSFLLPTLMHW
jgi:hypothetical protein